MRGVVDFFLIDSADITSFEPIFRRLPRGAFIAPGSDPDRWFDRDRALLYLAEKHLSSQPLPSVNAQAAITTQYFRHLNRREYRHVPTFRLMYGLAEKGALHGAEWANGFDAILCPGPYSRKLLEQQGFKAVVVGDPKHDAYFRGDYDGDAIRRKYGLPGNRRCILYVPTWGEHSSVDPFQDDIRSLCHRSDYTVIYKPHTVSVRMERQRIDCFKGDIESGRLICVESQTNLDELLSIADIVVTDAMSGALWDAVLVADLPTVALTSTAPKPRQGLDARVGECAPILEQPGGLAALLDSTHRAFNRGDKGRMQLREELLAYCNGTAAERAAAVLVECTEAYYRRHPISRLALQAKGALLVGRSAWRS